MIRNFFLLFIAVVASRPACAAALPRAVPVERISDAFAPLENLRTEGFALLPPGSVLTSVEEARLRKAVDAELAAPNGNSYLDDDGGKGRVRRAAVEAASHFEAQIEEKLHGVLPQEKTALTIPAIYAMIDRPSPLPHVDQYGYAAVHHAMVGIPLIVYRVIFDGDSPILIQELHSPEGTTAVFTRPQRRRATGMLPTIHSSPAPEANTNRRILTLNYGDYDAPSIIVREPLSLKRALQAVLLAYANR